MKFANPVFFWALLSLAVPIIIHLFHFRKFKTVYFTNVRFLKSLQQETQSRSRLKHLLILLARCLALAALVFAFAQPFIPTERKEKTGKRAISLYVDNSFSMNSRGESSSLFELAKKHAMEIVESYKETDRFQVLTNDFEGKHQRLLSKEQCIEMLRELEQSGSSRKLSEVIQRQRDLFHTEQIADANAYLISDFQENAVDFKSIKADTSMHVTCVLLKANGNANSSLDSLWFETPYRQKDKPDILSFSFSNYADSRVDNIPTSLNINGAQRGLSTVSAGADSSLVSSVKFTNAGTGFMQGVLTIKDYPVTFDDQLFFSYAIPEKITVLQINAASGSGDYLKKLFSANEAFAFEETPATLVDYASFSRKNLIVLNELPEFSSGLIQELKKFTEAGGNIVVFPPLNPDATSYATFANEFSCAEYTALSKVPQRVASLNFNHSIYDDVFERKPEKLDLPMVKQYFPMVASAKSSSEDVMKLQNGDYFAAAFDAGSGKIYQFCTPLREEAGNFQQHAIFIPTLYKIALYAVPNTRLNYRIGTAERITVNGLRSASEQPVKLSAADGSFEISPEQQQVEGKISIVAGTQIQKAGNYKLMQGDSILSWVSFNYPRSESSLRFEQTESLKTKLEEAGWNTADVIDGNVKEIKPEIIQASEGKSLWKIFVILALFFLLAEILLIRFLK
ncbi:MAG: vWA domain-containing protein [Bacteroidia bacterium]